MYGLWSAARAVVVFPMPPPPRIAILDDSSRSSISIRHLSSWSRSMIRFGFGGNTWWALIWEQQASILVALNIWLDTYERSGVTPISGFFDAADWSILISIKISYTSVKKFTVRFESIYFLNVIRQTKTILLLKLSSTRSYRLRSSRPRWIIFLNVLLEACFSMVL